MTLLTDSDFKADLASINQDLITRKILVNEPSNFTEILLEMNFKNLTFKQVTTLHSIVFIFHINTRH